MTTDSKHSKPIQEDHLDRKFNDSSPNQRWGSYIAYISTSEGWLYLVDVRDLFSRKIIVWSMSERMKENLLIDALKMALFKRKITSELLLHSDGDSQYASDNYQLLLRENNIDYSMSQKGNCSDNSVKESFFHSLKVECDYHDRYKTRDKARKSIFDYIEVIYNLQRKYSTVGYKSPEQFEFAAASYNLVSTKAGADQLYLLRKTTLDDLCSMAGLCMMLNTKCIS